MLKKYTIAIVITLLVLVSPVAADKKSELKMAYDKFKDETVIGISFTTRGMWHNVIGSHQGHKPDDSPDSQRFYWGIESMGVSDSPGDASVILLIDGERVKLNGAHAAGRHNMGIFGRSGLAAIEIDLDTLTLISRAKVVEAQIGPCEKSLVGICELKLKREHQQKIAALVQYFAPSYSSTE
jgi:hypothetical protein